MNNERVITCETCHKSGLFEGHGAYSWRVAAMQAKWQQIADDHWLCPEHRTDARPGLDAMWKEVERLKKELERARREKDLLLGWYEDLGALYKEEIGRREEARDVARKLYDRLRDATLLYDGVVDRVAELDDAIADWRYENEKLRRALATAIDERDAALELDDTFVVDFANALGGLEEQGEQIRNLEAKLSETRAENSDLRTSALALRRAMIAVGVGGDRTDEMMGDPVVVLDVAFEYFRGMPERLGTPPDLRMADEEREILQAIYDDGIREPPRPVMRLKKAIGRVLRVQER